MIELILLGYCSKILWQDRIVQTVENFSLLFDRFLVSIANFELPIDIFVNLQSFDYLAIAFNSLVLFPLVCEHLIV